MKRFSEMELRLAFAFARQGGQALHLFARAGLYAGATGCFKRSRQAGHLIDNDIKRLRETAKSLGVNVIKVGRPGRQGQHVDLRGGPLRKAIDLCSQDKEATL